MKIEHEKKQQDSEYERVLKLGEKIRQDIQRLEQELNEKKKALADQEKELIKVGNGVKEKKQELDRAKVAEQKAKDKFAAMQKLVQISID